MELLIDNLYKNIAFNDPNVKYFVVDNMAFPIFSNLDDSEITQIYSQYGLIIYNLGEEFCMSSWDVFIRGKRGNYIFIPVITHFPEDIGIDSYLIGLNFPENYSDYQCIAIAGQIRDIISTAMYDIASTIISDRMPPLLNSDS